MTTFQMYMFTCLDGLQFTVTLATILIGTFLGAGIVIYAASTNKLLPKKQLIPSILLFICFALGAILIPTQKEAAAIFLVPKMVNNTQVKNITKNTMNILEQKTQEWLQDCLNQEKENDKN